MEITKLMSMSSQIPEDAIVIESKFQPHLNQQKIDESDARFKIVVAGRRFGKTCYAINKLINRALKFSGTKNWYIAPTYHQAKEIAWKMLQFYLPEEFISKKNEAELKIELIQGSEIALKGADKPESLKGVGLNFVILDEYGQMKEEAWDESVRPMLVDSKGSAIFIGTPVGYNHFWTLYNKEKDDLDYESFHFRTIDNLAIEGIAEEVEKARQEMDPIKFSQEMEANFESLVGRPRFDHVVLKDMFHKARKPEKGNLIYSDGKVTFEGDAQGRVEVYTPPTGATRGTIGADIAEGIENDRSSASFLNYETLAEDVVINTSKLDPSQFAIELFKLGMWCNNALIAVEGNGPGLACILPLRNGQDDYPAYKNLYFKEIFDEVNKKKTKKFGFQTNLKTKPIIIDNLAKVIRENLITIPSEDTIRECQTYVVHENGKMGAVEGSHDDRVMALAIAVQMYMTRPKGVIPAIAPTMEGRMY